MMNDHANTTGSDQANLTGLVKHQSFVPLVAQILPMTPAKRDATEAAKILLENGWRLREVVRVLAADEDELEGEPEPDKRPEPNPKETFWVLARQWQQETAGVSSITKKLLHPCYLRIIALGPSVVPCILRALEEQPNHWFAALKALTGQDPVQPYSGFDEAVATWLAWGRNQGLI